MDTHVHRSTMYNSQEAETAQMSFRIDRHIVIYTYDGILFGHKKEQCTDTCSNVGEPQKCYTERRKPGTESPM